MRYYMMERDREREREKKRERERSTMACLTCHYQQFMGENGDITAIY
jgi:hypothetical protein